MPGTKCLAIGFFVMRSRGHAESTKSGDVLEDLEKIGPTHGYLGMEVDDVLMPLFGVSQMLYTFDDDDEEEDV